MERRLRSRLRPTNDSWRVDETYIRVKGKWVYLYRAVDSSGATIDFLLSAKRDAAAAERFLAKALGGENHPAPRVINTDEHAGYSPTIVRLKVEEALKENCRHRPVQYLNNVLEQDHRANKRGLHADHVTVWKWVQRYAPEMERRLRSRLKPTNDSWRVDETYVRVKGKWVYLYRAVDPAVRRSTSFSRPNAIQQRLSAIDSYLHQLLDIVY